MSSSIIDEENPLLTGTLFASAAPLLKKARERVEPNLAPIPHERRVDLESAAKNYRDALRLEQEAAHALSEARKHFEQCEKLADQAHDALDEIAQNIED